MWVQLHRCPRRGVGRGGKMATRTGKEAGVQDRGMLGCCFVHRSPGAGGKIPERTRPFSHCSCWAGESLLSPGEPFLSSLYVPLACVARCCSFFSNVYSQYLQDLSSDLKKSGDSRWFP